MGLNFRGRAGGFSWLGRPGTEQRGCATAVRPGIKGACIGAGSSSSGRRSGAAAESSRCHSAGAPAANKRLRTAHALPRDAVSACNRA